MLPSSSLIVPDVQFPASRFVQFAQVNFLNPERKVEETAPGMTLSWTSVTTGNLAGIDLWLDDARRGTLEIETNVISGKVDIATLVDNIVVFDGGGLGRWISVYRLAEADWNRRITLDHTVTFPGRCRPASLYSRNAGRRQPGLDQPDLSHRVNGRPPSGGRLTALRPLVRQSSISEGWRRSRA
jgi:hypothetical protein